MASSILVISLLASELKKQQSRWPNSPKFALLSTPQLLLYFSMEIMIFSLWTLSTFSLNLKQFPFKHIKKCYCNVADYQYLLQVAFFRQHMEEYISLFRDSEQLFSNPPLRGGDENKSLPFNFPENWDKKETFLGDLASSSYTAQQN